MSLINITNLTFAYDGSYGNIFTDVSLQIDTAWKLGFCGRNGRGKTTFLYLLLDRFPYSGTIDTKENFDYFPYAVSDSAKATIEILSDIAATAQLWQIQKELSKLRVTEDVLYRPFATLSNGEQTKILLAALFLKENNFLLIDEPTNHLDMQAREIVAAYLNKKAGYILVSHDRTFLDDCIDHILSINKNDIEIQSGNFSSWFVNRQRQDEFELAQNAKLQKDIKRLKAAAQQSADWADHVEYCKMGKGAETIRKRGHMNMDTMAYYGEKSRRMQQRRKNLQRRQQAAINEKANLLKNIESNEPLKIKTLEHHAERLLTVNDLSVSFAERYIFTDLNFSITKGERLAILGSNGSGKSTILKLICGEAIAHFGTIHRASKLIVSYVPQDPSFLKGDLVDFAGDKNIDLTLFKTILRKLDFSRDQFAKDMATFSAGQKKKVLIAASLCQSAHLYIWDEPLNYIDVLSRLQIEELIVNYQPTMIFVEHDRAFCENIATKVLEL